MFSVFTIHASLPWELSVKSSRPHVHTFTHEPTQVHFHPYSPGRTLTHHKQPCAFYSLSLTPQNERTKVPGFSFHVSNKDTTASLCSSSQLASITVRT